MTEIKVPKFVHNGKGVIINLHLVDEINLWKITDRDESGEEYDSCTVSPCDWICTEEKDRYITFGSGLLHPTHQFYDHEEVRPTPDIGDCGSATALFSILFPHIKTVPATAGTNPTHSSDPGDTGALNK